jgi:uncharacterized membrane protein
MVWFCIVFVSKYFNYPLLLMASFQGHVIGSITKCQIHWDILSINSSFVFSFFIFMKLIMHMCFLYFHKNSLSHIFI